MATFPADCLYFTKKCNWSNELLRSFIYNSVMWKGQDRSCFFFTFLLLKQQKLDSFGLSKQYQGIFSICWKNSFIRDQIYKQAQRVRLLFISLFFFLIFFLIVGSLFSFSVFPPSFCKFCDICNVKASLIFSIFCLSISFIVIL